MNWEAIGAVGEIGGALAVVVSLVYLAAQIRVQNREARLSAMHEISASFREAVSGLANIETADVFARALEDFDSLSDGERLLMIASCQQVLRVFEEAFHQRRENRLDQYIWDVMVKQYASFLSAGPIARVWELRKEFYDPDFRSFADDLARTGFTIG